MGEYAEIRPALGRAGAGRARARAGDGQTDLGDAGHAGGADRERPQPANLLLVGGQVALIDAGDGVAGQLAKAGVPLPRLGAVFLSHLHHDHVGGLAAVIGPRYQLGVGGVLRVQGSPGTRELVPGITHRPLSRIGSGMASACPGPDTLVEVRELTAATRSCWAR